MGFARRRRNVGGDANFHEEKDTTKEGGGEEKE